VTRLRLSDIPDTLKCVLWDRRAQRIITIAEYERQAPCVAAARSGLKLTA
jgi:hypothetical protein